MIPNFIVIEWTQFTLSVLTKWEIKYNKSVTIKTHAI